MGKSWLINAGRAHRRRISGDKTEKKLIVDRLLRILFLILLMWVVVATGVIDAAPPPKKLALTNAQIIPVVGATIAKTSGRRRYSTPVS